MKTFTSNQLHHLESSRSVPIPIINQKEIIFRNIKDIVLLHERFTHITLSAVITGILDYQLIRLPFRSILPGLRECVTDDDVAIHLIRHTEDFEKYLLYMVGQAQAEGCISEKAIQQYFKVCTKKLALILSA